MGLNTRFDLLSQENYGSAIFLTIISIGVLIITITLIYGSLFADTGNSRVGSDREFSFKMLKFFLPVTIVMEIFILPYQYDFSRLLLNGLWRFLIETWS